MADLYYEPALYGISDVTIQSEEGEFRARIYYPSEQGEVFGVPVRPGTYPLVAFAHGQRAGGGVDSEHILTGAEPGCPEDVTFDHRRWGALLHLLARCGFVVVAPALDDVITSSEGSATRLEVAITWIRREWEHRVVLWGREMFLDPDNPAFRQAASAKPEDPDGLARFGVKNLGEGIGVHPVRPGTAIGGTPTNLGLVGHSWGARACARVAIRGKVGVRALVSIAGSWDEDEANVALIQANDPTLLIAGTADSASLSYLRGLWPQLVRPKHQAAFQGIGHWDWFGTDGGIQYCDPETHGGRCRSVGWSTASEMLVGFMSKYLYNRWQIPPHLLGDRFSLRPWFSPGPTSLLCGPRVRWDDPMAETPPGKVGESTFGLWVEQDPW